MLQKVIQFLEKTVEWFALGLGVLFLAYTVWVYIVIPPVTNEFRTYDGQTVAVHPGDVDPLVRTKEAEPLESDIHSTVVPPFHVDNFGDIIEQKLAMSRKPVQLAQIFDSVPGSAAPSGPPQPETGSQIVTAIPTIPAATALGACTGLSTLQIDPSRRNDFNWVTVAFDLDPAQLHQAWLNSFGPLDTHGNGKITQQQMGTFFLNVKLYRSEQLGNGWSNDVEIPRAINDTLNAYPAAGSVHRAEQLDYTNWASNNQALIVAPPALPVTAGTPWNSPASLFGGGGGPAQPPDGATTPATEPSTEPSTGPSTAPSTAPSTVPSGASSANLRRSNVAMAGTATVYADRASGNIYAELQVAPPQGGGALGAGAAPAMPAALALDPVIVKSQFVPAISPVSQTAAFNPAALDASAPGLLIYLNDLTALPGKTYRYKIVYQIHNPLFGAPSDHVSDKSWVDQMDLTSPPSDYSPPITIKRHSLFFCDQSRTSTPNQPFPFDVVTWSDGAWRESIFRAFPGDMIGDSGATYVSGTHEQDTESTRIVTVDDNGIITARDAAADATSADRKATLDYLKSASQAPPPAALPPPAAAPGAPPGAGGATPNL